jgi:hypothetical protein
VTDVLQPFDFPIRDSHGAVSSRPNIILSSVRGLSLRGHPFIHREMGDPKVQSQERAAFPSKINGDHKATNDDTNGHSKLNIIDIRSDKEEASLLEVLKTSLRDETAEKSLPDLLLWDAQGLKLFEKITYLDSYYLTNQEIQLLEQECDSIAKTIAPGTSMPVLLSHGNCLLML